jgi:DNA-binding NtrC family response regulator
MALNRVYPGVQTTGGSLGNSAASTGVVSSGQRARWTLGEMVGRSSAMERLFLQMRYVANHLRTALIEGERGTGKKLVAGTLHGISMHRGKGFVACPADEFFQDNTFGGRLEQARGGTLYLSRVDALNVEQQGRLLHLLEWMEQQHGRTHGAVNSHCGALKAVGVEEAAPQAPRALLVSSERPLRSLVLRGMFRSDLHVRLSAVHLLLPPLRDRREDVAMLVERFLAQSARQYRKGMRGVMHDVIPALLAHSWPGNVRELQTVIAEAALRSEGEWLRRKDVVLSPGNSSATLELGDTERSRAHVFGSSTSDGMIWAARPGSNAQLLGKSMQESAHALLPEAGDKSRNGLAPEGRPGSGYSTDSYSHSRNDLQAEGRSDSGTELDPNLDRAILRHIRRVLESVHGNKLRAARLLGISRSTLYRLLDSDVGTPCAPDNIAGRAQSHSGEQEGNSRAGFAGGRAVLPALAEHRMEIR